MQGGEQEEDDDDDTLPFKEVDSDDGDDGDVGEPLHAQFHQEMHDAMRKHMIENHAIEIGALAIGSVP